VVPTSAAETIDSIHAPFTASTMTSSARPTRFVCLADGRVAKLTPRDAVPWPLADLIPIIVSPVDGGPESDALLPMNWPELRNGELRRLIAAALERETLKRRGH
jgi:hypothetical protein